MLGVHLYPLGIRENHDRQSYHHQLRDLILRCALLDSVIHVYLTCRPINFYIRPHTPDRDRLTCPQLSPFLWMVDPERRCSALVEVRPEVSGRGGRKIHRHLIVSQRRQTQIITLWDVTTPKPLYDISISMADAVRIARK